MRRREILPLVRRFATDPRFLRIVGRTT
jgi:hypothetical protein